MKTEMSKYDVKQEYKQTEGDPRNLGSAKLKEFAMRRMMAEVPRLM